MNGEEEPLVFSLDGLDGSALADRLAGLLGNVPGLRLARRGERADVLATLPGTTPAGMAEDHALTPRETEVLALLAEGASNKLIARRLSISVHTAKFHVGSLLDKLDATGRTDALAHAVRLGLVHL